jgi:hypothetical protein
MTGTPVTMTFPTSCTDIFGEGKTRAIGDFPHPEEGE